jgi:hypothetical protein
MANEAEIPRPPGGRLTSWKEIAAFFHVTVRTAQNWEAERGLPVHRIPGVRGRVYAEPQELLAWQSQTPPTPAVRETSVPHTQWRTWTLGVAVVAAAVMLLARQRLPLAAEPADYRVEGSSVIVLDRNGQELWRRLFDRELVSNSQLDAMGAPAAHKERPLFLDLDGDGSREFIFPNRARREDNLGDELYVFSARGDILWKYRCADTIRSRAGAYTSQYYIENVQLLVTPETRGLLVGFLNGPDEAANITLFSPQGQIARRYWHSGHIHHMLIDDLNRDRFPEIYLGGMANFYHAADVVVLDPRNFGGASLEVPERQILGFGPPVELARLILPRTLLSQHLAKYSTISALRTIGGELAVDVDECPPCGKMGTSTYFRFDRNLRFLDVKPGDITAAAYQHAYQTGLLKILWDPRELDEMRKVQYLSGSPLRAPQ